MSVFSQAGSSTGGLRALSLMMGGFLIFMGIDKVAWLTDDGILAGLFSGMAGPSPGARPCARPRAGPRTAPICRRLQQWGTAPAGECRAGPSGA